MLPTDRAEASILCACIGIDAASDADQELLVGLRGFLDACAATEASTARFDLEGTELVIEATPALFAPLAITTAFRNHRAVAHARTSSLAEAERQFRLLAADQPGSASVLNLARVLALQGRWDEADALAQQAQQRTAGDPGLLRLRGLLARGRTLGGDAGLDPVQVAVEQAQLYVDLGAPELARRAVMPLVEAHPDRPELVVAVTAYVADRRMDLARRAVLAARDRGHATLWDETLAQLQRLETAARAPQQPMRVPGRLP